MPEEKERAEEVTVTSWRMALQTQEIFISWFVSLKGAQRIKILIHVDPMVGFGEGVNGGNRREAQLSFESLGTSIFNGSNCLTQ